MKQDTPINELRELLKARPDPNSLTLADRRGGMEQFVTSHPPAADVSFEQANLGGVECEWVYTPEARDDRVIYYTHGGGYIAGAPRTHRALIGELARGAKARVLAVDYRLAPENPFPAAVEDAVSVYEALTFHASGQQFAIAGDSAGGGLALSVLFCARDQRLPTCSAAVLFSPWTDLTCSGQSYVSQRRSDPIVHPQVVRMSAAQYLGDGDAKDPRASPVYGNFVELPPMLIQVGSCEVLLDDSLTLDRRARRAGVNVTLEVWPEMVHVWHGFTALLPEAKQALGRAGAYLQEQWDS